MTFTMHFVRADPRSDGHVDLVYQPEGPVPPKAKPYSLDRLETLLPLWEEEPDRFLMSAKEVAEIRVAYDLAKEI